MDWEIRVPALRGTQPFSLGDRTLPGETFMQDGCTLASLVTKSFAMDSPVKQVGVVTVFVKINVLISLRMDPAELLFEDVISGIRVSCGEGYTTQITVDMLPGRNLGIFALMKMPRAVSNQELVVLSTGTTIRHPAACWGAFMTMAIFTHIRSFCVAVRLLCCATSIATGSLCGAMGWFFDFLLFHGVLGFAVMTCEVAKMILLLRDFFYWLHQGPLYVILVYSLCGCIRYAEGFCCAFRFRSHRLVYFYITSGVRGTRALALRSIKRWVQVNICAELLYVVVWLCDHIDNVLMYACIAMQVVVLRATPVELQGSLTWILRIVWRMRERARDSIAQIFRTPEPLRPASQYA